MLAFILRRLLQSVAVLLTVGVARGGTDTNVEKLAKALFTRYLLPFEATSVLLVIAVVGAVVLARRPPTMAGPPPEEQP